MKIIRKLMVIHYFFRYLETVLMAKDPDELFTSSTIHQEWFALFEEKYNFIYITIHKAMGSKKRRSNCKTNSSARGHTLNFIPVLSILLCSLAQIIIPSSTNPSSILGLISAYILHFDNQHGLPELPPEHNMQKN